MNAKFGRSRFGMSRQDIRDGSMQHPCQKDKWGTEKLYSKETEARPGYPLCIFGSVLYHVCRQRTKSNAYSEWTLFHVGEEILCQTRVYFVLSSLPPARI